MTAPNQPYDANQGNPSLGVLKYLQDNWGASEIDASCQVAKVAVASGSAGIAATIPVGAEILLAVSICTATNTSGTMTLKTGADTPVAITNAMQCATDKEVALAGTIDDATNVVGADGVKVFANADADAANVFILYKK